MSTMTFRGEEWGAGPGFCVHCQMEKPMVVTRGDRGGRCSDCADAHLKALVERYTKIYEAGQNGDLAAKNYTMRCSQNLATMGRCGELRTHRQVKLCDVVRQRHTRLNLHDNQGRISA